MHQPILLLFLSAISKTALLFLLQLFQSSSGSCCSCCCCALTPLETVYPAPPLQWAPHSRGNASLYCSPSTSWESQHSGPQYSTLTLLPQHSTPTLHPNTPARNTLPLCVTTQTLLSSSSRLSFNTQRPSLEGHSGQRVDHDVFG